MERLIAKIKRDGIPQKIGVSLVKMRSMEFRECTSQPKAHGDLTAVSD
jgi:hypothetical protein